MKNEKKPNKVKITAQKLIEEATSRSKKVGANTAAGARKIKDKTFQTVNRARVQAKEASTKATAIFRVNLANTLTLLNAVMGFLSIIASAQQLFLLAASFILIGVIFDWLDGKAARKFGEVTPLGRELDSLSDLVTFGVAPAFLVVMIEPTFSSYAAGALFVLSAALRLGRFNVQREKGMFFGVPTTTNGIFLPAMIFLGAPTTWFPFYLFIFALLMNAPIKLKKMF